MNFFFGIKNNILCSEITIPRFQNQNNTQTKYNLYGAFIKSNKWNINLFNNCEINKEFFLVKNEIIDNKKIFFLATENEIKKFDSNKLINLNNFTDTTPEYRANLRIYLKEGGFSSYQSEYPYDMIDKNGSLLSSVSSIANKNANKNFLLIRNIFKDAIEEKFNLYFVDIKLKKIIEQSEIKTNHTNQIEINKLLIHPEVFVITKKYLGIPIYVSEKNGHLSIEHTHPPHEYILGHNKYEKVKELKSKINEIIN
jgi:hypothetical protein